MKFLLSLVFLTLPFISYADTFEWDTTIGALKSYSGSSVICFNVDRVDRKLCFDKEMVGGDIKLSMILSAKMSSSAVDVSYSIPQEGDMAAWYNHNEFYKFHHFYIR